MKRRKIPNRQRRSSSSLGRFTCYHGGHDDDNRCNHTADSSIIINTWYEEAARRLPLDDIPELADCLADAGCCLGLAHPVTNIILNTIHHHLIYGRSDSDSDSDSHNKSYGFSSMSHTSFRGLLAFLKLYFPYLTDDQARRYLHIASYNLLLAIHLLRHHRRHHHLPQTQTSLLPDGGNVKAALRIAALQADHPAPDDLARIMTAQYPSHLLTPIIRNLQRSNHLLTTHDVRAIKDLLHTCQWPPPNTHFLCCPCPNTCAANNTLQLATCIGGGAFARISIQIVTPNNHGVQCQLRYISDLTFGTAAIKTKLSKCISVHATQHIPTDDSPPCAHILSLYMCLLDAIHAFFIRALAALPLSLPAADSTLRRGRLLRSLLVSGHCYGPLDPVSNIILNAIWYDAAYPLPPLPRHQGDGDDEIDDELPQDISDTRAMARMASRSLNGLITLLRAITTTTTGAPLSKHEAVEYLWSRQCDLTDKLQQQHTVTMTKKKNPYAAAADASKHPQHTALGSFLLSLSGDGEKLDRLRHLLRSITDGSGRVISDADWEQLNAMMIQERLMITKKIGRKRALPPPSAAPQDLADLSKRRSAYVKRQRFARSNLEELLLKYCRQHPWEPRYKLDVICGVEEPKSYHWRSYHANFLASANGTVLNGGEANPPVCKLFFAEFWDSQSGRFNKSNSKPICCPVQDYNARFGRLCSFCDEPRTILHPPCATGSHSNDDDDADADVIPDYNVDDAIRMYGSVAPELSEGRDLVESDIIYFDHERDAANLTQVLSDPSFKEEDNSLGRRRKQ